MCKANDESEVVSKSTPAAEASASPGLGGQLDARRACREVRELFQLGWPQTVSAVTGFAPRIFMLAAVGHLPNGAVLVGAAGIGSMYANFSQLMLIRSSTFGASPLLSQAYGAGNHIRVGVVLMRVLAIHAVAVVCFSLPLTAIAGPLLTAAGQPATVVTYAQRFIWIRLMGLPGVTVNIDVTTFLNAQRCVRLPMVVNILSSLLQVALCYGLTRSLGFDGAPLAMTIVELLGAAVLLLATPFVLRRHRLRSWPRWRREGRLALQGWGEIVSKGGAAAVMVMAEWFGWECTLFVASGLCEGEGACAVVDAIPICTTVFVCEFLLVFGWGMAACNRVGNLLGEGRGDEARFSAAVSWVMAASSAVSLAAVIVAHRRSIAAVFVDADGDEAAEVLEVTASLMRVTTAYSVLATLAPGWSQQILFGLGAPLRVPAALNFFSFYAVGIPGGALLAYHARLGVEGIWMGLVVAVALMVVEHGQSDVVAALLRLHSKA
tara:strand:- start:346 stop:1821 length:1476 start_codon:yes stop_codon:yes gene_type:complete